MENSETQAQSTVEQPSVEAPVVAKPAKNNKKTLYFICGGVVALIAIVVAIILIVNKGGSEVVCTTEKSMYGATAKAEVKISFNKNGYAAHMENKMVADMGDKASDATYEAIVKSIAYSYYSSNKGNITNSINAGHTSLGDDTKIERNGSVVTITSVQDEGKGEEADQSAIDSLIKSTEKAGYTCKR